MVNYLIYKPQEHLTEEGFEVVGYPDDYGDIRTNTVVFQRYLGIPEWVAMAIAKQMGFLKEHDLFPNKTAVLLPNDPWWVPTGVGFFDPTRDNPSYFYLYKHDFRYYILRRKEDPRI